MKNKSWMRYLSLGTEMIVTLGVAAFIAIRLDKILNTSPLFIIILPLIALISVLYRLIRTLDKGSKNKM